MLLDGASDFGLGCVTTILGLAKVSAICSSQTSCLSCFSRSGCILLLEVVSSEILGCGTSLRFEG